MATRPTPTTRPKPTPTRRPKAKWSAEKIAAMKAHYPNDPEWSKFVDTLAAAFGGA